jgi:hypothetical protein
MANEQFIRGKKDDARHAGLRSNRLAEQEANAKLQDYLRGDLEEETLDPREQKEATQ